ncbi:MAG: copper chaperone PCu(A)C [Gemmatimonadota bacterium]|jgi:hypothetical protein
MSSRFRQRASPFLAAVLSVAATVGCDAPPDTREAPDAPSSASPTPAPSVRVGGLTIEDLVVAEPVTNERTALYLTVRNQGELADALVALEAEGVGDGSLHATERQGDLVRMRSVDEIALPPGGEVRLRPGGHHGMLEGIAGEWSAGDTVMVRLRFRAAGVVEAPALVVPYAELPERFGSPQEDEGEAHGGH